MSSARRAFNDLPSNLKTYLESNEDFENILSMFFLFFKKIKRDIDQTTNAGQAARAMVLLEYIKSELEQMSKSFGELHHNYRTQTVPKVFEELGLLKFPLPEGFVVEVKPRYFCSIKAGLTEPAHDWLRSVQLADIIKPTVHPKTLVSAVEELLTTQGIEPPEKYFNAYQVAMARVTKSRTSKTKIEEDSNPFEELGD
jgi:hypothetical protein